MLPRPSTATTARRTRRWSAAIATALLLSACNADTSSDVVLNPDGVDDQTTAEQTATPEPEPSTGTPTSSIADDVEAAAATWSEVWQVAGRAVPSGDDGDLVGRASSKVLETFADVFVGDEPYDVTSSPTAALNGDSIVEIDDCLYSTPAADQTATTWWRGEVGQGDDGAWTVTEIDLVDATGCVPAEMANEVLEAYAAYERVTEAAMAAPEDPGIVLEDVMTGEQLMGIREVRRDLAEQRAVVRLGEVVRRPKISEVRSPDEVVVSDCQTVRPADRGVFHADTGERIGDQIGDGASVLRLQESAMTRGDDGIWRTAVQRGSEDVECDVELATTALPVV